MCVLFYSTYYLPSAAFWGDEEEIGFDLDLEDEFISKKTSKNCIKETIAKGTKDTRKWQRSLEKAVKKALRCVENASDEDAMLACESPLFDITTEYCPVSALTKVCSTDSFEFEDFAAMGPYHLMKIPNWLKCTQQEVRRKKTSAYGSGLRG